MPQHHTESQAEDADESGLSTADTTLDDFEAQMNSF